jgi:coatomer subunit beta'
MGGVLLGVKGSGFVALYDWDTGALVRRIDVTPNTIYWSDSGELVVIACDETFYVLRFSREEYAAALSRGEVEDDGVESAFEVVTDINETIRTGEWVGDCFIYTNSTNRLNYLVGDQTYTISHFDSPMYLLGYIPRDSRIYLADKDVRVVSYSLSLNVVEYQTVVLRGDMDAAAELLKEIPADQKNKIARFLEGQGYKELALEVATDPEHCFELALSLNNLAIALEIARKADVEHKWKTVGDAAITSWDLVLAKDCFIHAKDFPSLLLLYTATGDAAGLRSLAKQAKETGANNVAFSALWQIGDVDGCVGLLSKMNRLAEAALLAKTYKPSIAAGVVGKWKASLLSLSEKEKGKIDVGKKKVSEAIAVPGVDEELFPDWGEYLQLEVERDQGGGSASSEGVLVDAEADGAEEEEEEDDDDDDDEDEEEDEDEDEDEEDEEE